MIFHLFLPFSKSILSNRIQYSFRALNSSSNHYVNLFFKWIFNLKKSRQIWEIVCECVTFHLFFLFSPHFLNRLSLLELHIPLEHWILHRVIHSKLLFTMNFSLEKNSSSVRNCLWMCNIPSFFPFFSPFSKSIFSIGITYCFRALNCASNHIVNIFFQCILRLEKTRQIWRIVCECVTFYLFFSLFSPFSKSIFSIRIRWSVRALNSVSNDLFNLFFQRILIVRKTRQIWGIVCECVTFHIFFFFFSPFSKWIFFIRIKLHILLEHWILHRVMHSICFKMNFSLEKNPSSVRNCLWIGNIPCFFPFLRNLLNRFFSIRITYFVRALNSASNEIFNRFFQWVLILKKLVKYEKIPVSV